jgi:hemolysin activation/secretion protein
MKLLNGDFSSQPSRRNTLATAGILIIAALQSTSAVAQAANPGFDPGQPAKHFEAVRRDQQRSESRVAVPTTRGGGQQVGSGGKLFVLRRVSLDGARAIPAATLAQTFQAYLGKQVSQADLAAITEAVTQQYRAAGYHLSRAIVPVQDIRDGVIQIKVIEGTIADVKVDGDAGGKFDVAAMLAPTLAAHPSRQDVLERQLLLINARPGIRVADTALEEIGVGSGRFRLTVYVKTWQVYTSFGVDNLGSRAVGPWQTYATGAFNSYLLPGDSLVVNLSTTPADPRQLAFGRIGYDAPIGIDGIRAGGSALYSEVRPGDWRRDHSDVTKTESFELHASVVPLQSQTQTLTLTAGFQFTNISESDVFGALYNDHLRTISLTEDYMLKDEFGGTNYLTATLRQGIDVLGASRLGDDYLSRFDGSGTFTTVNLWFARYQTLTDTWSLKISAAGQYASTELLTSQQYYLGGAVFGRGYGSAEISGDNAMAGSLELRYDGKLTLPVIRGYQLFGFIDSGAVWNVGYGYRDGLSLTSAGGGLRLFFDGDLRADIGIGAPLSYRSPTNENRSPMLLFSVSNSFRLCPEKPRSGCS